jgi:DNA-directed RNA polymerase specialized sigma24 family protein
MILSLLVVISRDSAATYLRQEALLSRDGTFFGLARMEGYSVEEIAEQQGYAARSIKRKLQLIRAIWEKELEP